MNFFARSSSYRELWQLHNVRWLANTRFLVSLIFYSTVMVQYQSARGLNYTEMFALESIISLFAWIFDIPTGILADRIGYKRVLILGHALDLTSLAIFVITRGFWPFAFASVLYGTGLACISGCESALVYESLPPEQAETLGARAFALLNAASSAGFLLGLATGSFLGAHNPALPFVVTLIPLTLALLATLRLRPLPRESRHANANAASLHAVDFLRSALQLIRDQPRAAGLSLLESAAFALANAIFWYNQPYFSRAGISVAWFGPITAAAVGLGMLVVLATPFAKRRLRTAGALALSCLIPALGYIALAITHNPLLIALLVAIVVAGPAWRQPIINDELNRAIKDGARATTLSALSTIGTVAGITLNPLIGQVGDLGLVVTGMSLGAGLMLCGLTALMLASSPTH